jgi:hypothetical protein
MEALKQAVGRFDRIPQQLKDRPRWVLWKLETISGSSKPTKIPKQPSGHNANATDASTWSTFGEVCAALDKYPDTFSGIGFVFNGDGITGIDYDKCIVEGEISPEVLEAIEEFDSYTEFSPSGTGLHTFVFGQLPEQSNNRRPGLEVYETARYFTVTGEHFHGSPLTIEARQEQLEVFVDKHLGRKGQSKVVPLMPTKPANSDRVAEIIEAAAKGKGKKKFTKLFKQGDCSGYPSASEAVQGLLCILRHYTQDPSELDAVFRSSELYKQHWSHKWDRLAATEIARVLDGFTPEEEQRSDKRQQKATFEDVKQLIRDTFPDKPPRTDLFSGKLHVWHKGRWMKVGGEGLFDKLETIMRHSGGFFNHAGLKAAIHTYADELTPELLIDIPAWDGRDRVSELADACNVVNIPKKYFGQFLKAWGAKMFQRAYDNRKHQNNCIILKGSQGIGKDQFIDALVGGLDLYAADYSPQKDEVRKTQILSSLLVVKIPEFERMNKIDPDAIKFDITSNGEVNIDKFGKETRRFEYRCSWIASANTFDFFRDHTGNRRFWVFVIDGKPGEAIRWGYPDSQSDKIQILAQFRQLAAEGYEVSADAKSSMDGYIARMTPEDPAEVLVCDFDIFVTEKIGELGLRLFDKVNHKGWSDVWMVPNHYLESWGIFDRLARLHGITPRKIQATLKGRDRDWKTGAKGRGYLALDTAVTLVTDEKEDVSLDVSLPNI